MKELIYAGGEVENLVRNKWPGVVITDRSDIIHEDRFEVDVPCEDEEFYIFAIREDFAWACLRLRTMIFDNEGREKIKRWSRLAEEPNNG